MSKTRVVVAMSGGVDSSVAAALLKSQGYDPIGVMLNLWVEDGKPSHNRCCSPASMSIARYIAGQLEIPFYVIDVKEKFFDAIVSPFIDDYNFGITPNPCLRCNKLIRWKILLEKAKSLNAVYIATGHYAQIDNTPDGQYILMKGADPRKDQSYVLYSLSQYELAHTLFPVGNLEKSNVRELAKQFNLPVAEHRDSQDLCFIGDGTYREFLSRFSDLPQNIGYIRTDAGEILGSHKGLRNYTIGQRKGIDLYSETPMYVIGKELSSNTLIIGKKAQRYTDHLIVQNVNWISRIPDHEEIRAAIQIRYRSEETEGTIRQLSADKVQIQLNQPALDITPGQAAVFYSGNICLGGGIIKQ